MSVAELRATGRGYLIQAIETTTSTYPNGTVRVTQRVKMESRLRAMELLGRTMDLWKQDDPDRSAKWLLQAEKEARAQLALAGAGEETTPSCPDTLGAAMLE